MAELRHVSALLTESDPRRGPLIVLVTGTAGVGKTAFAIHWAQQIAEKFPDGQLYLNLRGFDPSGSPLTADEAVDIALQSFEVAPPRLPAHPAARRVLYRSLLAGRRMLLLLDNARDADQIRPLLAGGRDCVIIVTSRMKLTGIVAEHDARLVPLGLFTQAESREMLAARLGTRLEAEPGEVDLIIDRCAGLPLALTVVAARAASCPAFSMADIAADLEPAPRRLDSFGNADPAIDVRTVLSWSYHGLPPGAASMFRLLARHPGRDIALASAVSLAGLPLPETRRALDELVDAALLAEPVRGRFSWHDLLRAYAEEVRAAAGEQPDQRAADQRLLAHYIHSAHAAAAILNPHQQRIEPPSAPPHIVVDTPAAYAEAMAWASAEHANVMAATAYAEAAGLYREAFDLASATDAFHIRAGRGHDRTAVWHLALVAAEKLGDLDLVTTAQEKLGQAYADRGDQARAEAYIGQSLKTYRAREQWASAADCYANLGLMAIRLGDFARAIEYHEAAMDMFARTDREISAAIVLNNMGCVYQAMGNYDRAVELCAEALGHLDEASDPYGAAHARDSLALAYRGLGRLDLVIKYARQAADAFIELKTPVPAAEALCLLGEAHEAKGNLAGARTAWEQAVRILGAVDQSQAKQIRDQLKNHLELGTSNPATR